MRVYVIMIGTMLVGAGVGFALGSLFGMPGILLSIFAGFLIGMAGAVLADEY